MSLLFPDPQITPKNKQEDKVPYVKAKNLYFHISSQVQTLHVPMYWYDQRVPSSAGVAFRILDWLTFV